MKIFWITCVLCSATACGYMISQTFIIYLSYETVSKTETILEIPSAFPTVSICNLNPFQTAEGVEFANQILAQNYAEMQLQMSVPVSQMTSVNYYEMKYFIATNAANPNLTDEYRQSLTIQLNSMIISCYFDLIVCSASDFEWYFDNMYGSCFKFNSGKNSIGESVPERFSTKTGPVNGFILELYVGNPDYMQAFAFNNGAHLLVHNKV